jgi:ketosteroid isomerase-like protein
VSRENVEIIRRLLDASNRRDAAAVSALLHPEVEFHVRAGPAIGIETLHGRDAALSFIFKDLLGAMPDFRTIAEAVSELRDGHVLAVGRYEGRGTVSGVETRMDSAAIYRLDAGMIVFFQDFATRREALKAVGLEE